MIQALFPVSSSHPRPEFQGRRVLFGNNGPHTASPQEVKETADGFYRVFKAMEGMADEDGNVDSALEAFLTRAFKGDHGMLAHAVRILRNLEAPMLSQRSCEFERDPDTNMISKVLVRSGLHTTPFEKRRNIFTENQIDFNDYLKREVGSENKLVIAVTGWTKPPVEFLLQDPNIKRKLEKIPKESWPVFAERFYVAKIKDFLADAVGIAQKELEAEGENFNPETDLAFVYGVTPEGVDRAVEEFCHERGVKAAGITCYDWAQYIPDAAGKPPVFLAKDPAEFGSLMSDASNKIVVVGGRSYAANMTMDGKDIGRPYHKVPIDIMAAHGIDVPGVVQDYDNRTAQVLNASKVLKTQPGGDPEQWDFVRGAHNIYNVPRDVFIFSQVLKQGLRALYATRDIHVDDL